MKDELKRAVEALGESRGITVLIETANFLATHGDALLAQAEENERLRTQLAESEAACAGYRAALGKLLDGDTVQVLAATEANTDKEARHVREVFETARQALQSNPGKTVGDVIAAAKRIPCKTLAAFLDYEQDAGRWRGENGSREAQNDIRALDAAMAKLEGGE